CEVATAWFSTAITERTGSATLNITTAFTRAVTLSRVMTSWGGMVRVTTRWSTRTERSRKGSISTSPGPSSPRRRPSRKTTRRSYSRTTFSEATSSASSRAATMMTAIMTSGIPVGLPSLRGVAGAAEREGHGLARLRAAVRGVLRPATPNSLGGLCSLLEVLVQRAEQHSVGVHGRAAQVGPQRQPGERDRSGDRQQQRLARPGRHRERGDQREQHGQDGHGARDPAVEAGRFRGGPGIDGAADLPPVVGGGAGVLHRAAVAHLRTPPIPHHPVARVEGGGPQPLVLRAPPRIVVLVIDEAEVVLLGGDDMGAPGQQVDAVGDHHQHHPVAAEQPGGRLDPAHELGPSDSSSRRSEASRLRPPPPSAERPAPAASGPSARRRPRARPGGRGPASAPSIPPSAPTGAAASPVRSARAAAVSSTKRDSGSTRVPVGPMP